MGPNPKNSGKLSKDIPIRRGKLRCAFKLTAVTVMWELMGRAHSGKTRSEASVGIQGRVGDSLDQGAGQYPKHAGLQGGKNI